MKQQNLLVICLFLCYCSSVNRSYAGHENFHKKETAVFDFINLVQKRYYIIRRLEGAVDRLLSYHEALCGPESGTTCSLEKELSRVTTFWQDCLSYKYIMNDTHMRDFLVHVIVLYDALYIEKSKTLLLSKCSSLPHDLEGLLRLLDRLVQESEKQKMFRPKNGSRFFLPDSEGLFMHASENVVHAEPDEEVFDAFVNATTDDNSAFLINTTMRFYMTQRLAVAMERLILLTKHKQRDLKSLSFSFSSSSDMQSPAIRDCILKMNATGSVQPLFALWKEVKTYRYIGDMYLIKELLMLSVNLYKVFIKALSHQQEPAEVDVEEVLDLYISISSLPFPELLMLLDDFSQQSLSLVDIYQQGATVGWKAVFKQYWWVPPVMIAGVASLYMRIKNLLGHQSFRKS